MASLKLSALLLICVIFVLVAESESRRRPGNRQRGVANEDGVTGRPGRGANGRRGGGRGAGQGRGRGGRRRGGRGKGAGRGAGRGGGRRGGRGGRGGPSVEDLAMGLSRSMNTFSVRMHKELVQRNDNNFVFSPFSVMSAMSMVHLGASAPTKQEIFTTLSLNIGHHMAMKSYNMSLVDDENTLSIANAIYVKPGFRYKPKFVAMLRRLYNSSVGEFQETNPEEPINDWIEEQTGGEIEDFLEDGSINQDTLMMLINAIYFKGLWADKFDVDETSVEDFHVSTTETADVDMMTKTGDFKTSYSQTMEANLLELPYKGDRFAMFIIMPRQGTTLDDMTSRMTPANLNEALNATVSTRSITIKVPKFSLDSKQSMKEILKAMGMTTAFEAGMAKFNKMARGRDIHINDVQHQAVIKVDEEGTVAAAVTGVEMVPMSLPQDVVVNKPFMFVVRDKTKNINLFMGRFSDPNGDNIAM